MRTKAQVENLCRIVVSLYFFKHDYLRILPYLSTDFTWIGIGRDEICMSPEDLLPLLMKEDGINQGEFVLIEENYQVCPINTSSYYVLIMLLVKQHVSEVDEPTMYYIRSTQMWIKENNEWKLKHVHDSLSAIAFEPGEYLSFVKLQKDYTQNKVRDHLTQINNAQGLEKAMDHVLVEEEKKSYILITLSIRHFRIVNKKYGYAIGDDLLKDIAICLQCFIQEKEVCGRVEKDIFSLLLVYEDMLILKKRFYQLEKQFIQKQRQKKREIQVYFKLGLYMVKEEESIKERLDKALWAMNHANEQQTGHIYSIYNDQIHGGKYSQVFFLEEAYQAMDKNEFELYIQPQFGVKTKEIVSGEALVRWKREGLIYKMPNDFIPLFEECGFILEFDFYMLEKICQNIKNWLITYEKIVPISINQSQLHIEEPRYFERFLEVIDRYGIPHKYFIFELTESVFVENTQKMKELARQLHEHHFQLAIDDFGTGYASLNLLSVIKADILKIDKGLLENYTKNTRTQIIIRKIIEMAHQMGMVVVCEGVEKRKQLLYLEELECDIVQGFLLGRPEEVKLYEKRWFKEKVNRRHEDESKRIIS